MQTTGSVSQNLGFSYNGNGDRTTTTDLNTNSTISSYGYNQADQLTSFTQGSTSATYTYDGDGLRASKTVNGTPEAFTWDIAEGMPLIIQDGSTKYITGPDGLPLEQIDGSGNVLYYVQDQLGNTRGLIDGSGNVQGTYTYGAYGDLEGHSGGTSTPFGYAGQYTDAESGLVYMRARYYDPSSAEFLVGDPMQTLTGDAYTYGGQDPLNAVDPTGACPAADARLPQAGPSSGPFYDGVVPVPQHPCHSEHLPPGTLSLNYEQLFDARLIYATARLFGIKPEHAREMVAAAFRESSLLAQPPHESAGHQGLFGLGDRYLIWADTHGGAHNPEINILAIINRYRRHWALFPSAAPGEAARSSEASYCVTAYYADPLSHLPWWKIENVPPGAPPGSGVHF